MDIKALKIVEQTTIGVFCCYAREDLKLLLNLKKHMMPLQRKGLITLWADVDIGAGTEWEKEIHLSVATLLVPWFVSAIFGWGFGFGFEWPFALFAEIILIIGTCGLIYLITLGISYIRYLNYSKKRTWYR